MSLQVESSSWVFKLSLQVESSETWLSPHVKTRVDSCDVLPCLASRVEDSLTLYALSLLRRDSRHTLKTRVDSRDVLKTHSLSTSQSCHEVSKSWLTHRNFSSQTPTTYSLSARQSCHELSETCNWIFQDLLLCTHTIESMKTRWCVVNTRN